MCIESRGSCASKAVDRVHRKPLPVHRKPLPCASKAVTLCIESRYLVHRKPLLEIAIFRYLYLKMAGIPCHLYIVWIIFIGFTTTHSNQPYISPYRLHPVVLPTDS
jgi:hypothetical protein